MSGFVYFNPATGAKYYTGVNPDPNVPIGYLLTNTTDGSAQFADGVTDQDLQTWQGGVNSGGFPAYQGDTTSPPGSNGVRT